MEKTTTSTAGAVGVSSDRSNGDETKYKGVRKRKWGKWVSEIRLPNSRERIWLGSYDSPEKAARAFDAALFCLRGRNAKFNFPNCPPDIPGAGSMTRDEIRSAAARFANEAPVRSEASSSSASEEAEGDVAAVDWSFLNLWESNEGVSDFGIYSGLQYDNMGTDLYQDQESGAPMDHDVGNGDGNDGEAYAQPSFLWNF